MVQNIVLAVAFVLVLASMVLVVVRVVKEQGYWRLLFSLVFLSFALQLVSAIFSRDTSEALTYFGVVQASTYVSGLVALTRRWKAGIFLYSVAVLLSLSDSAIHPPPFSAVQYLAEGLSFAVDGAVAVLAWILMTTDLGLFAQRQRVSTAF